MDKKKIYSFGCLVAILVGLFLYEGGEMEIASGAGIVLGLYWGWRGVATLLNIFPGTWTSRKFQTAYGAVALCLGLIFLTWGFGGYRTGQFIGMLAAVLVAYFLLRFKDKKVNETGKKG